MLTPSLHETLNPLLPYEFIDVLKQEGYEHRASLSGDNNFFYKGDRRIMIFDDALWVDIYNDTEDEQRLDGFSNYAMFKGVGTLDPKKWKMLLQVCGALE